MADEIEGTLRDMTMVRFRRVAQLWNWLPAFRGVAEHPSIQRAATALGVSPSALSRTVKLLEDDLGAELFLRQRQGMHLTPFGEELLAITRDAMRQVDDCIQRLESGTGAPARSICVGIASPLIAGVVARALPAPSASHRMQLVVTEESGAADELLRGDIDVVFATEPPRSEDLRVEPVGRVTFGVYARRDHPLAKRSSPIAHEELSGLDLMVPGRFANAYTSVVGTSDVPDVLRLLCERSDCLGIIPDDDDRHGSGLARLADAGESLDLHAAFRKPLEGSRLADLVRDVVADVRRALA